MKVYHFVCNLTHLRNNGCIELEQSCYTVQLTRNLHAMRRETEPHSYIERNYLLNIHDE